MKRSRRANQGRAYKGRRGKCEEEEEEVEEEEGRGGNGRGSIIIAERLVKLPPCTLLKRNEIIMILGLIDVERDTSSS